MVEFIESCMMGYVRENNRGTVNEAASRDGPMLSIQNSRVCGTAGDAGLRRLRRSRRRCLPKGQHRKPQCRAY